MTETPPPRLLKRKHDAEQRIRVTDELMAEGNDDNELLARYKTYLEGELQKINLELELYTIKMGEQT
jgi:hypothetical protein